MSSSVELFRGLYPEFSSVADATVTAWLSVASARLSPRAFGTLYQQAAVMMAAHFVELSQRRVAASGGAGLGGGAGLAGPITSVKTGGVAMSTQGVEGRKTMTDNFFSSTDYGLSFLALMDLIPTTPIVANDFIGSQLFSNATVPEDLL